MKKFCKHQNGGKKACKGGIGPFPKYYFYGIGNYKGKDVESCYICRGLSDDVIEALREEREFRLGYEDKLEQGEYTEMRICCSHTHRNCQSGKLELPLEYFKGTPDFPTREEYLMCYFCKVFKVKHQLLNGEEFTIQLVEARFRDQQKQIEDRENLRRELEANGYKVCGRPRCPNKFPQAPSEFVRTRQPKRGLKKGPHEWCKKCRVNTTIWSKRSRTKREGKKWGYAKSERTKLAQTSKYLPCLSTRHNTLGSKYPKDEVPVALFMRRKKLLYVHSTCKDCRGAISEMNKKILVDVRANGQYICSKCKVITDNVEDMGVNLDGSTSAYCKVCKYESLQENAVRAKNLKKVRLEHIFDNEACCKICGDIILLMEGQEIPIYIKTFSEDGVRKLEYQGEIFEAKAFIEANIDNIAHYLLDFDHLPEEEQLMTGRDYEEKFDAVSRLGSYKLIKAEAEKCVLICKKCHITETIRRLGHIRGPTHKCQIEARKLILEAKAKGCEKCGYTNAECPGYFHFDHIDPLKKNCEISVMYNKSRPVKEIKEELELVRVLCANCHYLVTREQRKNGELFNISSRRISSDEKVDEDLEHDYEMFPWEILELNDGEDGSESSKSLDIEDDSNSSASSDFEEDIDSSDQYSDNSGECHSESCECDLYNINQDDQIQIEEDIKARNKSAKSFLMGDEYDEKYETYPNNVSDDVPFTIKSISVRRTPGKISSPKVGPAISSKSSKVTAKPTSSNNTNQTLPYDYQVGEVIPTRDLSRSIESFGAKISPVQRAKENRRLQNNELKQSPIITITIPKAVVITPPVKPKYPRAVVITAPVKPKYPRAIITSLVKADTSAPKNMSDSSKGFSFTDWDTQ